MGLYRDNGEENGNYCSIIGYILGLNLGYIQTMFGNSSTEQQRLEVQGSIDAVLWRRIDPADLGIEFGSGRALVSLSDVRNC